MTTAPNWQRQGKSTLSLKNVTGRSLSGPGSDCIAHPLACCLLASCRSRNVCGGVLLVAFRVDGVTILAVLKQINTPGIQNNMKDIIVLI